MHNSRIDAVENVCLQAAPGLADKLHWFYAELVGLEAQTAAAADDADLVFKSGPFAVFIRFVERPQVDSMAERITLRVNSLEQTEETLRDRRYAYTSLRGVHWTDHRLTLLDPAGHRIELRKQWPPAPV